MAAAVGRVQVDEQVRIELAEQAEQHAGLGRVGLDEVAVEVEALRVGALAGGGGAVLAGAVAGADLLVAGTSVFRAQDAAEEIRLLRNV